VIKSDDADKNYYLKGKGIIIICKKMIIRAKKFIKPVYCSSFLNLSGFLNIVV